MCDEEMRKKEENEKTDLFIMNEWIIGYVWIIEITWFVG
jgi:hypothetical protein